MSESIPETGFRLANIGLLKPLSERNFLLLWAGSALSYVGSQLTMIAFPWLVLKLSGDALAIGTVLALSGIPRAVFMLFGGAFTDRYSPRTIMLWVNWLRMFMMFGFAFLIYTRLVDMWMVYVLAFLFGVIDAFFWPSSSALVPRLLPPDLLPAGNALIQGMGQLSLMLGPVLAGVIIAWFADESAGDTADLPGIAVVFLIDGIGFLVAIVALLAIRLQQAGEADATPFTGRAIVKSIAEGFGAMWQDVPMRIVVVVFTVFALFFRGPYVVGMPLLCDQRFPEGALAFGMISSAFGVGSLIGLLLAGSLPRPAQRWYGYLMMGDIFVIALGLVVYAYTPKVEFAMLASAVTGVTDGYIVIILISWLQVRVPANLMGRVMSLIMFFTQGVTPISAAVAGALFRWSLEGVFLGAGVILVVLSLLGLTLSSIRNMDDAQPGLSV